MAIRQGLRSLEPAQLDALIDAFSHIKAEQDRILSAAPLSVFVHTDAYRNCEQRFRTLLVGRKGVGKTALVQTYGLLQRPNFATVISLEADEMMFDRVCGLIVGAAERVADLRVTTDRVSMATWQRALAYFALLRGAQHVLDHDSTISTAEQGLLKEALAFLAKSMTPELAEGQPNDNREFHSLFDRMLRSLIDDDDPVSRGVKVRETFDVIAPQLTPVLELLCRRDVNVLVTLDEFDDFVDSYLRRNRAATRKEALADLFKGLVIAVRKLDKDKRFAWLRLIIAVPQDKFIELMLRERAAVDSLTSELTWGLPELQEFIDLRLSHALGTPTKWQDLFGFAITNGNAKVQLREDSFRYLVRHTLRRPRELMILIRAIFTHSRRHERPADEETIRAVVSEVNERIVQQHFLPEYVPEYPGLPPLLAAIRAAGLHTVMTYKEFEPYVLGWAPWNDQTAISPPDALARLYQMGLLGLREVTARATCNAVRQLGQTAVYHFEFTGTSVIDFLGCITVMSRKESKGEHCDWRIVFSPMFFEYLRLTHRVEYVVNELG